MLPLGLSVRDKRAYMAALVHDHRRRCVVRIHDHDEKVINTIHRSRIVGGSVQVDMSQAPHRTLELVILEPRRAPAWLPEGPGEAAVFADNFVSVQYGLWVDDLEDGPGWVDVPVFWGPMTGVSQDGDQVTIQAHGKELLGLEPHYLMRTMNIPKGQRRTLAIRRVMMAQGERRFDLPELAAKVNKKLSLNRHAQPFRVVKAVGAGEDWQVFFDGRGRLRARRWPQNRLYTFKGGPDGGMISKPSIAYDVTAARNTVEVMGPEPKGPPKRIHVIRRLKPKHPLSAYRLRRNGEPRHMVHVVDSDLAAPDREWHPRQSIKRGDNVSVVKGHWGAPSGVKNPRRWTEWAQSAFANRRSKARRIADRQLEQRSKATIDVTFDHLPVPHLEEGDKCVALVNGKHIEFVLKAFTIPLVSETSMSIGFTKRVSLRDRRRKHRRKSGKP